VTRSGAATDRKTGLDPATAILAGEIGPVAGKNFLHGFTASILLFRES